MFRRLSIHHLAVHRDERTDFMHNVLNKVELISFLVDFAFAETLLKMKTTIPVLMIVVTTYCRGNSSSYLARTL